MGGEDTPLQVPERKPEPTAPPATRDDLLDARRYVPYTVTSKQNRATTLLFIGLLVFFVVVAGTFATWGFAKWRKKQAVKIRAEQKTEQTLLFRIQYGQVAHMVWTNKLGEIRRFKVYEDEMGSLKAEVQN